MLQGSKESCSPNLEALKVSSSWAWVPVKMSLPSAAMLTRKYCLPILHKPVEAESLSWAQHTLRGTVGRGGNATCLPQLLHESLSGLVHDSTRSSDHPPLHGPCHWVRASGGCASLTSLYSRLESSSFSSGFEVLLSISYQLVVIPGCLCYTPKTNYP